MATVNKIISALMKANKVSQREMALRIGKEKATQVSSRLKTKNMTIDSVIEMLEVMGYELVVQLKLPGKRPRYQIVLNRSDVDVEE